MNTETLSKIGLTKGESNVYITLLKLGNTSTGQLIRDSNVSRSKVYDVLERLKQKGLVTEVTKRNIRFFEATNPKRILDYLNYQKEDIEKKIEESKQIVSDLNKLRNLQLEKQEAKIYSGIEGIKTVYNEILDELDKGEEYLAFGLGKDDLLTKEASLFIKKFHLKRQDKKVNARIILNEDTKENISEFKKLKYYKFKFTKTKFPTNIAIWNESVLTLVWSKSPIAFVIKSKQVSDRYKKHFEYLWK